MSDDAVARVYAEALFAAAQEAGSLPRVRREIGEFAAALETSVALRTALFDPQIGARAKERVLLGLAGDADPLVLNTLRLALDKDRLAALPAIGAAFERLAAEADRTIDVEVVSAVPLDETIEARIVRQVEEATGLKARLSKRVDEAVIGGLVLRVGDVVLDASLKTRVQQLRAQMQRV